MSGRDCCVLHSGSGVAAQLARQRATARHPAALQEFRPPTTALEVRGLLSQVIVEVRAGALDHKRANSVAVLASALLRAIGESDFEQRLRAIEAVIQQKGPQRV